jgi:hypothetical protein
MSTNIKSCSKFVFVTFMPNKYKYINLFYHSSFSCLSNFLHSIYILFVFLRLFHQFIHCSFSTQTPYIPSCHSYLINPFPLYRSISLRLILPKSQFRFLDSVFLTVTGCRPFAQAPTWRASPPYL